MKIVIIGSRGTLGQYMAQTFGDCDTYLWDKEDLDIVNQQDVDRKIKRLKPNVVINCAAYNGVDVAENDQDRVFAINAHAVGHLATVVDKIGATLIHYSTGYVFDGKQKRHYTESHTPNPLNTYGHSKLLGEKTLRDIAKKYYLIRTSRLYGKTGSSQFTKKSFVDLIIDTAKENNYKVKGIHEEYDLPTYAYDLAQKTREIIDKKLEYGTYHVCNSGKSCTWYEFAKEIFNILDMDVEVEPVDGNAFGKRAAERPMYASMKSEKIKPLRKWQEALRSYLIEHN